MIILFLKNANHAPQLIMYYAPKAKLRVKEPIKRFLTRWVLKDF